MLLSAGCTVSINLGENSSDGNTSDSTSGNVSDSTGEESSNSTEASNSSNAENQQTQKTDASEDEEPSGAASDGNSQENVENEVATELLNAPTINYCNINGVGLTEGYFVYTNDDTYGELFTFTVVPINGSYIMMIAAFIPPSQCKEGLVLKGSELTSNAQLYYLYIDGYSLSAYELLSSQNSQSFANMEFCLYSYTGNGSAVYSIKADITDENGNTKSVDLGGGGAYTDPSQFQQIQGGNNTGSDGSCWACHGSKICTVCYGKRKYYVSGYGVTAGTYVNCAGCNGTGRCSYCS